VKSAFFAKLSNDNQIKTVPFQQKDTVGQA
jgi:hypothetical protein